MWKNVILQIGLFTLISTRLVLSQELKVNKVIMAETDIAARENPVIDANGTASAIVKARLVLNDIRFISELGINRTEEKNGEIWLWVPPGTGNISVITGKNDTINVKIPAPLEEYSVCIVLFTLIINDESELVDMPSVDFTTSPSHAGIFVNDMYQGKTPLTISMLPDSFSYRIDLKRHYPVTGKDILASGGKELYFRLKSMNRIFLQVNSDIFLPYRKNIGFTAGTIGATGMYLSFSFPLKNADADLTINSAYGNPNFDSYYLSNLGTEPYLIRHTYAALGATRYIYGNVIVMCGIAYGKTDFFQTFQAISYFKNVPPQRMIVFREDLSGTSAGFDIGLAYWIKKKVLVTINSTSFITARGIRDEFGSLMLERPRISISDLKLGVGYSF